MTEIVSLDRIEAQPVGGKAAGLARLIRLGLPVPPGFVLLGAGRNGDALPARLFEAYRELGAPPVAVRSSAAGEDGAADSFAGQYDTVLNVAGDDALEAAVWQCLRSARSRRARAYGARRGPAQVDRERPGSGDMAVIVQQMVDARAAGVVFTVDSVTGRRDRLVVDAVEGLGEALVSGHAAPDHYALDSRDRVARQELVGDRPILTPSQLGRIAREARAAERAAGHPMDLEWALDREGRLFWLQARPITTLGADPRELDTPCGPRDVLTLGNTSEMMPGAVGALTISTTVRGVDRGTLDLLRRCGVQIDPRPDLTTVGLHFGHIFFNLSALRSMADQVAGSTVELLCRSICGRPVPELGPDRPVSGVTRGLNGARYFWYVLSHSLPLRRLERFLETFVVSPGPTPLATWQSLDAALSVLDWTYSVHLQSSSGSGVSAGMVSAILSKGRPPGPAEEAALARLLAEATGVVSAELVFALDRVGEAIAASPAAGERFVRAPPDDALGWLQSPKAGDASTAFARFLEAHGHRSLRELDMHQPCWADDPEPLIRALQASVRAQMGAVAAPPRTRSAARTTPARAPKVNPLLRGVVAWARQTVRNREHTKSILVDVTNRLKRVYRRLGEQMAAEGLLPDAEAAFFLTHEELGQQLRRPTPQRQSLAVARREVLAYQQTLEFPMVCVGPPEPLHPADVPRRVQGVLQGRPVSSGVAEGPVRVAGTVVEAEGLLPGEILVAPVTDVGWTPYFGIIAGLATEVGSAISHGAVVAREYGLPAVVNLPHATHQLRTGQRVRLDGDAGTITVLDGPGAARTKETSTAQE